MRKFSTVLAGLAGLGLLTYLCASAHRTEIEAGLVAQARQKLTSPEFSKIRIAAEGQTLLLSGTVADSAAKTRAGGLAAAVNGVAAVDNRLEREPIVVTAAAVPTAPIREQAIGCQQRFDHLLREPIQFGTGKAIISPRSHRLLDRLTAAARACPAAEIEVGGHTDARGSRAANLELSQKRAEAVVRYLVAQGIEAGRLSAVGYGPDRPRVAGKTGAARRQNRRTEFKVKGLE